MRYLQILVSAAMISYSHSAMAIQTTEEQLNQLRHVFDQQTLNMVLVESRSELDKYLQGLSSEQSTWLKHQWLRKLSVLTQPSVEQQAWLNNQLMSTATLTIANSDHPNQQLTVIDIARQAKTSQQHWKINQQVALFQKQWGTDEWRWQEVLNPQYILLQKAFSQWIRAAGETLAEQVAAEYITQVKGLIQPDNRLLALLAEHAKSADLYELLWQNTADEYSYQALASLPGVFEESVVIDQTLYANKNNKLQSQALFLLANRYSHNPQAQQAILAALDDPEAKWLSAAVLNKIADQAFLADVRKKLNQQKPSNFRTLALNKISQLTEYEVEQ